MRRGACLLLAFLAQIGILLAGEFDLNVRSPLAPCIEVGDVMLQIEHTPSSQVSMPHSPGLRWSQPLAIGGKQGHKAIGVWQVESERASDSGSSPRSRS